MHVLGDVNSDPVSQKSDQLSASNRCWSGRNQLYNQKHARRCGHTRGHEGTESLELCLHLPYTGAIKLTVTVPSLDGCPMDRHLSATVKHAIMLPAQASATDQQPCKWRNQSTLVRAVPCRNPTSRTTLVSSPRMVFPRQGRTSMTGHSRVDVVFEDLI